MSFDAQCDVAAVVYGAADDPDRLIAGPSRPRNSAGTLCEFLK